MKWLEALCVIVVVWYCAFLLYTAVYVDRTKYLSTPPTIEKCDNEYIP